MAPSIREIGENFKKTKGFNGRILFDENLSLHTSMKVGGKAALFVEPSDEASLLKAVETAVSEKIPYYILGGGSNLIFADSGFKGMILSLTSLNKICIENGKIVTGAGVNTCDLADFAAQKGIAGLTNFAGLPGTAGGACYMNARCYDKSFSEVIESVRYLDIDIICKKNNSTIEESAFQVYHIKEEDWSYKHSPFMEKKCIILSVTLRELPAGDSKLLMEENQGYIQNRRDKGHFTAPSAGSVFKNNRSFGKPSGVLIDECGLKSMKNGGAQVAPWHGNIIINTGNATASDIAGLVKTVQDAVFKKTGFNLENEIIFVN